MAEDCHENCMAHGRLDERVTDMLRRITAIEDDLRNRSKTNWQTITTVGVSFLLIAVNLILSIIRGN